MNEIRLLDIKKEKHKLEYIFSCSENLNKYFTNRNFEIEYEFDIEEIPDSILSIPFVANVIQIMWMTDCKLYVSQLDKSFYESLREILNGYMHMFPDVHFAGELFVESIIDNQHINNNCDRASLFSGGVDATTTVYRHYDSLSHLIVLWGADVDYDNDSAWNVVHNSLQNSANQYNKKLHIIKSSFRKFDSEKELNDSFYSILGGNWWHHIKHSLGIIGHTAPLAYKYGIKEIYIASSYCNLDKNKKCASDPTIDNHIRFCGTKIIHDAYEMERQSKIRYLVNKKMQGNTCDLHVCWKSQNGKNCSNCEKCYRTMVGLWIEGADPREYGFSYDSKIFKKIYKTIALREEDLIICWHRMKEQLILNWDTNIMDNDIKNNLKWMKEFDFINLESNKCRIRYRKIGKFKSYIAAAFPALYRAMKKNS